MEEEIFLNIVMGVGDKKKNSLDSVILNGTGN